MSNANRPAITPNPPGSSTPTPSTQQPAWQAARAPILQQLQPQLTGRHWLQLSCQQKPLLTDAGSLLLEVIDCDASSQQDADRRMTSLSPASAEGIICDDLIQRHPQPQRLVQEIQTLIRPGGWLLICGNQLTPGQLTPLQITKLFKAGSLIARQCYSHQPEPPNYRWQAKLNQLQLGLATQLAEQLPSLLPALCGHAATQAGWVMLFKAQDLATTPLASPLKLRRNKLQTHSAVCIRSNHWRTLASQQKRPELLPNGSKAA